MLLQLIDILKIIFHYRMWLFVEKASNFLIMQLFYSWLFRHLCFLFFFICNIPIALSFIVNNAPLWSFPITKSISNLQIFFFLVLLLNGFLFQFFQLFVLFYLLQHLFFCDNFFLDFEDEYIDFHFVFCPSKQIYIWFQY